MWMGITPLPLLLLGQHPFLKKRPPDAVPQKFNKIAKPCSQTPRVRSKFGEFSAAIISPRASDCFSCPPRNRGSRTHNSKIYEHFIAEEVVVESLGVKRRGGTKAGQIDLRGSERPKNNTVRGGGETKIDHFSLLTAFAPSLPLKKV